MDGGGPYFNVCHNLHVSAFVSNGQRMFFNSRKIMVLFIIILHIAAYQAVPGSMKLQFT
jgi:hypothetical protein